MAYRRGGWREDEVTPHPPLCGPPSPSGEGFFWGGVNDVAVGWCYDRGGGGMGELLLSVGKRA